MTTLILPIEHNHSKWGGFKTITKYILLFSFLMCQLWAQNNTPIITNLNTVVDNDDGLVTINYDLWDDENDDMSVALKISNDDGITYLFTGDSLTGDVGYPITSGNDKQILWYYQTGTSQTFRAKIVADDLFEIDIADLVAEVDSVNLFNDLTTIEGVRHRTAGIEKLEETKELISSRFTEHNLQSTIQTFRYDNYNADNLIGKKLGQDEEEIVYVIDGHYDTVVGSPGADDNGSAVVGMLEAMRVLSAYNFNHTIEFIGFDLEEYGLLGSYHYVSEALAHGAQIAGVFNFEMIGYTCDDPESQSFPAGFELLFPGIVDSAAADENRGNFLFSFVNETGAGFLNEFDTHAAQYVPELRVLSSAVPGNGEIVPDLRRSDHTPFWDAGIPALFLNDGGNFRNLNYHTAADTVGTLDFTFMSNIVKATVATVADLAGIMHCGVSESESFEMLEPTAITNGNAIPANFTIFQNFPNPFNPSTTISYELPQQSDVRVVVYDIFGQEIATLVSENQSAGYNSVQWIGLNNQEQQVSAGMYLYVINAGKFTQTRKMILLK